MKKTYQSKSKEDNSNVVLSKTDGRTDRQDIPSTNITILTQENVRVFMSINMFVCMSVATINLQTYCE